MATDLRWNRRPEGSTWGDFGPDDQCGRMNLLTPAKVLQGMAEVRTGQSFNLSLPLDFPGSHGAWNALIEITDATLLAQAMVWMAESDHAQNRTYNVTDTCQFRWRWLWPRIAAHFNLAVGEKGIQKRRAEQGQAEDRRGGQRTQRLPGSPRLGERGRPRRRRGRHRPVRHRLEHIKRKNLVVGYAGLAHQRGICRHPLNGRIRVEAEDAGLVRAVGEEFDLELL